MVRFGKKAALLAMAGVLTAASVTGCSGAIDAEATVVTVGKEKVPLGVVNFYAQFSRKQSHSKTSCFSALAFCVLPQGISPRFSSES